MRYGAEKSPEHGDVPTTTRAPARLRRDGTGWEAQSQLGAADRIV